MSTWYGRSYRPQLHFTPPFGWINDPNGLCYREGLYHLFAQYYPYDTVWGPMHWIHAVSEDLLHWRQLGIALRPDEDLGMIFSGSAVWDRENSSGLGNGQGPLVAMFTHHGEREQQSIAWTEDGLHFAKYAGNPVIPNPGCKDFRDPMLFADRVRGGWSAVVAAGDHVEFYRSSDLLRWEKTGEFGRAEDKGGGVFECPDLFPLRRRDGSELWCLICSNTHPPEEGGHRTQYFLGQFDGETFRQTVPFDRPVLVDAGPDNYAAVSFAGAPEPTVMGWASSWVYGRELPTGEYRGQLTLPRRVSLAETAEGPRLAWAPAVPKRAGTPAEHGSPLPGETFRLTVRADGPFTAALSNDGGEAFRFGMDGNDCLFTDRSRAGLTGFHPLFGTERFQRTRTPRMGPGPCEVELLFDVSVAELFADGGLYANTTLVFPAAPYTRLELDGAARAELSPIGC